MGRNHAGVEDPDAEESMLCRPAPPRVDDEQGQVEIPNIVWPQALICEPWMPAVHEAAAPDEIPEIGHDAALLTPAVPAEAALVQYPGGAYEIRLRFAGVAGGTMAEATYRTYGPGGPGILTSMTEYQAGGGYDAANTAGVRADFKVRFFNAVGRGWLELLASAHPRSDGDR